MDLLLLFFCNGKLLLHGESHILSTSGFVDCEHGSRVVMHVTVRFLIPLPHADEHCVNMIIFSIATTSSTIKLIFINNLLDSNHQHPIWERYLFVATSYF